VDIEIKGVQKTSLLDYPGKVAAVIFVSMCNFRCPYCHNGELVLNEVKKTIEPKEIIDYLEKKRKWVDGVCITGGEPTMHKGLPDFIKEIKNKGFLVKLDTNGTNPEMVEQLLNENLLDYIAMDIKASLKNYEKAVAVKFNENSIQKTIHLIMNSCIDYEFRTTVVPGLFDESDAEEISVWLKGAKKFCLQQFKNTDKTLDPKFQDVSHYHVDMLEKFKSIISKNIKDVEIRGV